MSQEAVTLETLDLLQKTLDYLQRLPVVPLTRALCNEIEAHLADPGVAAARRAATVTEQLAATRGARVFDPACRLRMEVTVTATHVSFRIPKVRRYPGEKIRRTENYQFNDGLTMALKSLPPW
jgi:hypothetical protein